MMKSRWERRRGCETRKVALLKSKGGDKVEGMEGEDEVTSISDMKEEKSKSLVGGALGFGRVG